MREEEAGGSEGADRDEGGVLLRNVSESIYPGRRAVTVRTTHLQGSDEERQLRRGLRRLAREGGPAWPMG